MSQDLIPSNDNERKWGMAIHMSALIGLLLPLGLVLGPMIVWMLKKNEGEFFNVQGKKDSKVGYNVLTEEYVDMLEAGVIDPAKVTRGALENAASIAAMILTTEALITDIPAENSAPAMPPGGMGGGMPGMM